MDGMTRPAHRDPETDVCARLTDEQAHALMHAVDRRQWPTYGLLRAVFALLAVHVVVMLARLVSPTLHERIPAAVGWTMLAVILAAQAYAWLLSRHHLRQTRAVAHEAVHRSIDAMADAPDDDPEAERLWTELDAAHRWTTHR